MSADGPKKEEVLSAGAIIGDHEIVELIGRGGFGEVYRAVQRRLRREVAIKVVSSTWARTVPDLPQRFKREIDLASRLEHPNIFRIYDCGESDDGVLWMAMEFIRGDTLSERLTRDIQLDFVTARHITLQILSGLMAAHEQLIIHRDLKPGNIMLTRQGIDENFVKILDFGIGKALGEAENKALQNLTQHGQAGQGTPRYMAPEQIRSEDLGPWTDLYAVGLIFYEMLMGRPAVEGRSLYEVLANQMNNPIRLPTGLACSPVGAILQRALDKNPHERYQTAQAFFEQLCAITHDPDSNEMLSASSPIVGASQLNTLRPLWTAAAGASGPQTGGLQTLAPPLAGEARAASAPLTDAPPPPSMSGLSGAMSDAMPSASASLSRSMPSTQHPLAWSQGSVDWDPKVVASRRSRSKLIVAIMAVLVLLLGVAIVFIIDWRSRGQQQSWEEAPAAADEQAAAVEPDASDLLEQEQSASAPADDLDWSAPLPAAQVDSELMDALMAMAMGCERVDRNTCTVNGCRGKDTTFDALLKTKGRVASLETMCAALESDDSSLVTVAAERLGARFAHLDQGSTRFEQLDSQLARRLIEAVERQGGCRARNVLKVAVPVAYLTGTQARLEQVLAQHPLKNIKQAAYPWLMMLPRMKGFERVRQVLSSNAPAAERAAAFDAVLKMPEPSLQEYEQICPWARDFLDDAEGAITAKAAALLIQCRGSYIDELLVSARAKLTAGRFAAPFSESLREVCFQPNKLTRPAGTPSQCAELYTLLESVVQNEALSPELRAAALWNIYYQKRDQATLDMLSGYLEHPVREIRVKAREAAESLIKNYGLAGALPSLPGDGLNPSVELCEVDHSWSGAEGPLQELSWDGEHLYVLATDGSLRRFKLALEQASCQLSMDKAFGSGGVLEMNPPIKAVSAFEGRLLLSTAYSGAWLRERDGSLTSCNETLTYRFGPQAQVFGFRGERLKKVDVAGGECSSSMWSSSLSSIEALAVDEKYVYVGGMSRSPGPNEPERVVLGLDAKGIERLRFGTKYKTEDGFAMLKSMVPCALGVCVLDGPFKAVTLWTSEGAFVARINTWDFPVAENPATASLVSVGSELLLAANVGGLGQPLLEGRILRIRGLSAP
ncbi:MAG: serine/threonine-protein kinase [Myxococcota bacterium]|jgi:serine/threonine-protein kinase|nr:serine/threonine-protein kinase [Myxococcota bacterium]